MSPERSRRILDLLPAGAIVVAEAGWLATWYAAVELSVAGPPLTLGLWAFALAVAAGLATVRWRGFPRGAVGDVLLVLLAIAAVIIGAFADPASWSAVAGGGLTAIPSAAAGSWLLAVAVWRGSRHGDRGEEIRVTSTLLGWGVPLLAIPWVMGARLEPAAAADFVGLALPATLVFVAAGLFAIGIARLEALGIDSGVDWRTNRSWLGMLGALLVGLALVGLPAGIALGAPIAALLATALGPLQVVLNALVAVLGLILGPLLGWLTQLSPRENPIQPAPIGPPAGLPQVETTSPLPIWIVVPIVVALGIVIVAVVVAILRRPRSRRGDSVAVTPVIEERTIVMPAPSLHLPTRPRWRLGRRRSPASATDAYLALLADLDRVPELARRPTETPWAHARRLRTAGDVGIGLPLLAADYSLERYAGRRVSERETRRAIGRSREISRAAHHRPRTEARAGTDQGA